MFLLPCEPPNSVAADHLHAVLPLQIGVGRRPRTLTASELAAACQRPAATRRSSLHHPERRMSSQEQARRFQTVARCCERRDGASSVSGTRPAHPLPSLFADHASPCDGVAFGRAVCDEPVEADRSPRSLIAKMFQPRVVNKSEETSTQTWGGLIHATARIAHSRIRIAVACGQPRRGKSVAASRSTSRCVVSRSAWSKP
jgi:hypothetical protein